MFQWNSRATSCSSGQSKFIQDHRAHTKAFRLALAEPYPSDIRLVAATSVYPAGVRSVTWLENRRTTIVRSSIWRWRTRRKLQCSYHHPSSPHQRTYKPSQLVRRRTLRWMHLLALKTYTAAKAQEKEPKGQGKMLTEISRNIWSRRRLAEGEVEILLLRSRLVT